MKKRLKFYGFAPISGEKIIGHFFKIKGRCLLIHNGIEWRSVIKIFVERD